MKSISIIILGSLFIITSLSSLCFAQDKIILKNGHELNVKVVKVDKNVIEYQKINDSSGDVYIVNKSQVSKIDYKNGASKKIDYVSSKPVKSSKKYQNLYEYKRKDPNIALLWSVIVPGGGEIYANGSPAVTIISYGAFLGGLIISSTPQTHHENISVYGYNSNYSYKTYHTGYLWAGLAVYAAGWIYGMADSQAAVQRANQKHGFAGLVNNIQPTLLNTPSGKEYMGLKFALRF